MDALIARRIKIVAAFAKPFELHGDMDTVSPEIRSRTMRAVKKENTSLERKVRSALHRRGLRFRLYGDLPGKPDIVFVRARVVVFIDSCFWHGCPLHVRMPKSNQDYWNSKIARNVERDAQTNLAYKSSGWTLMRFWEHDLKENLEECVSKIEKTARRNAEEHATGSERRNPKKTLQRSRF